MTIENDISRIATALEALVSKLDHIGQVSSESPCPPPVAAEQPAPPAPPSKTLSPVELNEILFEEFKRLGSRDPIDRIMGGKPFCVTSVNDLPQDQYTPLIEAVRAVKA